MQRAKNVWLVAMMAATVGILGCGSSGSSDNQVSGKALSVVDQTEQPDRDFVVVDLAIADDPETETDESVVGSGKSDTQGNFIAKVPPRSKNVLVVFPPVEGQPRTSGLVSFIAAAEQTKDLRDFTDIACVAGATAVAEGSVPASAMDATRIANLEEGAREVLATQSVDFNDSESFNAAVSRVREATSDGDHPPDA